MPFPFPGMNPYLENPELWQEVHHILISLLAETLNPQLLPTYRVAIEKRVYDMSGEEALLVGIPDVTVSQSRRPAQTDSAMAIATPSSRPLTVAVPMPVEIREGYLEVREVATHAVVTVIEVLSPSNKRPGRGRDAYLHKRNQVLASATHLVEIDLLRAGDPMPTVGQAVKSDYRILISRGDRRPTAELYAFGLKETIPSFSLPLKPQPFGSAPEPVIELDSLLQRVIERAGLDVVLDYQQSPIPALDETDATWLTQLLNEQGRSGRRKTENGEQRSSE